MRTILLLALASLPLVGAACDKAEAPAAAEATATQTIVVEVKGMHCEACTDAITAKCGTMDGVKSLKVDLEGERATFEVDAQKVKGPALVEAIDKLGFEAKLETPSS